MYKGHDEISVTNKAKRQKRDVIFFSFFGMTFHKLKRLEIFCHMSMSHSY